MTPIPDFKHNVNGKNFQCKLCISKYEINDRHQIKIPILIFCALVNILCCCFSSILYQ